MKNGVPQVETTMKNGLSKMKNVAALTTAQSSVTLFSNPFYSAPFVQSTRPENTLPLETFFRNARASSVAYYPFKWESQIEPEVLSTRPSFINERVTCARSFFTVCIYRGKGKGRGILTTQQQQKTMRKPWMAPAVPTTQVSRMKRMTPKMFWMQGRKTPMSVPMRAPPGFAPPGAGFASGSAGAGIVLL